MPELHWAMFIKLLSVKCSEQILKLFLTVLLARKNKLYPLIQDSWVFGEGGKGPLALTTKNTFA